MSSRPRKRRSTGGIYETEPNVKQVRFNPPRRTIRDKHIARSAPSKYQQTITQMNPFHAIYHPDSENENLEYDEEEQEASYVASPVGRKRRRITPEKPAARKIETRSSARKALKAEPMPRGDEGEQMELPQQKNRVKSSKPGTSTMLMPPPQTPRSTREREIPSSQSPADSPLSTQSRRSVRGYSRSPLKERSTNVILPTLTPGTVVRWATKLEVADSMENEEEDSPVSTWVSSKSNFLPNFVQGAAVADESPRLPSMNPASESSQIKEILESSQRQIFEIKGSIPAKTTVEIIDSDDGDGDFNDEFGAQVESTNSNCTTRVNQQHTLEAAPANLIVSQPKSTNATPKVQQDLEDGDLASRSQELDNLPPIDPPLSDPPIRKPPSQSEEASAQLFHDLQRATQPAGLQTESQYEAGWASYHPADASNNNDDADSSTLLSSSPEHLEHETSAPMTVPTQLLPPSSRLRSPPFELPVPPSQATTTDITQLSPRKMPSSSPLAFTSSPPPMPPSSSSPVTSRRVVDPWLGFEWNGVRLTDSQLLPESLMDDSISGPPGIGGLGLSQEEYEEEDE